MTFLAITTILLTAVVIPVISTQLIAEDAIEEHVIEGNTYISTTSFTLSNPTTSKVVLSFGDNSVEYAPGSMPAIISEHFILTSTTDGKLHGFYVGQAGTTLAEGSAISTAYSASSTSVFTFSDGKLKVREDIVALSSFAYVPDGNGDYVRTTNPIWNKDKVAYSYTTSSTDFGVVKWDDGEYEVMYHATSKVDDTSTYTPSTSRSAVKTFIGHTEVYVIEVPASSVNWIVPHSYTTSEYESSEGGVINELLQMIPLLIILGMLCVAATAVIGRRN